SYAVRNSLTLAAAPPNRCVWQARFAVWWSCLTHNRLILSRYIGLGVKDMYLSAARNVEFKTIKQLVDRLNLDKRTRPKLYISVTDADVPRWQRQIVWTSDEMGLVAYSIIQN